MINNENKKLKTVQENEEKLQEKGQKNDLNQDICVSLPKLGTTKRDPLSIRKENYGSK